MERKGTSAMGHEGGGELYPLPRRKGPVSSAQGATPGLVLSWRQRNSLTWSISTVTSCQVQGCLLPPQLPQPPGPGLPSRWGEEPALEPISQL